MNRLIYFLVYYSLKLYQGLLRRLSSKYLIEYCSRSGVCFNKKQIKFDGLARLSFHSNSKITIGDFFRCVSSKYIGMDNNICSKIVVHEGAVLAIGNYTGITNSTINCHCSITIGNYVNIGAGCVIMDSDFHSLDWHDRIDGTDIQKRKDSPIEIKDLAFIGAHSIILKGVTIGEKSIVGAGSVVSCNIPDGQIWAGNPARYIKEIKE